MCLKREIAVGVYVQIIAMHPDFEDLTRGEVGRAIAVHWACGREDRRK